MRYLIPLFMKYMVLVICLILFCALVVSAQKPPAKPDFLTEHQISSIAILPPVGESVPTGVREEAGSSFIDALRAGLPSIMITAPAEVAAKLGEAGRLEDFTSFLTLFVKTGTINSQALERVGEASGSKALLLIDVQQYEAQNGSWLRMRNGHNAVRAQYTLLSPNGEKLWQTLVNYVHTPQGTAKADKTERVMQRVSKRAVKALLTGAENSDPKKESD